MFYIAHLYTNLTAKFTVALALSLMIVLFVSVPAGSAISIDHTPRFGFKGCPQAGTAQIKVLTKGNKTVVVPYEQPLQPGTKGACVVSLQQDLNAFYNLCGGGYPSLPLLKVKQNGQLGTLTTKAIRDYQDYRGIGGNTYVNGHAIVVNGDVDIQTWAMLHDNSCSAVTG